MLLVLEGETTEGNTNNKVESIKEMSCLQSKEMSMYLMPKWKVRNCLLQGRQLIKQKKLKYLVVLDTKTKKNLKIETRKTDLINQSHNIVKSTLMQIWKSPYMFVFMQK